VKEQEQTVEKEKKSRKRQVGVPEDEVVHCGFELHLLTRILTATGVVSIGKSFPGRVTFTF